MKTVAFCEIDGFFRMDRTHALGNAVVPQIPELIGRAILAHESGCFAVNVEPRGTLDPFQPLSR